MIIPPVYTQQNDDFGEDPGIRDLLHSTKQGKSLLLFRIANENPGAF
jgi:hypothetical protein